jgi:hypothetical protein
MPLILTAAPAAEPVALAEAKAHLRVDSNAEDTLIASLIVTSRLHVEATAGLALMTQSWSWYRDAWPMPEAMPEARPHAKLSQAAPAVELPLRPVQSIAAVRLYDAAGAATTLDPATYLLDGATARLIRHGALAWPRPGRIANGIEIAFTAGFGPVPADVPAPLRQAILLLVAHWYEHRSPLEGGAPAEPPPHMVSALLRPYRSVRL